MKKILAMLLIVPSLSFADSLYVTEPVNSAAIFCKTTSLLYRISGELRDKKVSKSANVAKLQTITKINTKDATDIVDDVYDMFSDKDPKWIEGFVMGACSNEFSKPADTAEENRNRNPIFKSM